MICVGCEPEEGEYGFSPYKSLPAPLAEDFPYEIPSGERMRVWGGENFELSDNGVLHFLILEGVSAPKPSQPHYEESRKHLIQMLRGKRIRTVIQSRDHMMREMARVYVDDVDVNLQMVKDGMAWWDGTEINGFEEIKMAEAIAREAKLGLFANPEAVHPSEFQTN